MTTDRAQVINFFEEFFSKQLNQSFDEQTRVEEVEGLDSLAMVDLSISFEDEFDITLSLEVFKEAVYLRDIVDVAIERLA